MIELLSLFHHQCDVFETLMEVDEFGVSNPIDSLILEDLPCRFRYIKSFLTESPPSLQGDGKLYLPPHIEIQPGAKIIIYLEKNEAFYRANLGSYYSTHGELSVTLIERWV